MMQQGKSYFAARVANNLNARVKTCSKILIRHGFIKSLRNNREVTLKVITAYFKLMMATSKSKIQGNTYFAPLLKITDFEMRF